LFAAVMQTIRDAQAAARLEGDVRALALFNRYAAAMQGRAADVMIYGMNYRDGSIAQLGRRRRGT
jgi:hypothetical protein